jgi:hypothetical protein
MILSLTRMIGNNWTLKKRTIMRKIKGNHYCCGATCSMAKKYNRSTSKGIHIFADKMGNEINTEHTLVKHIETKNGTITVALKLADLPR